MPSLSSSRITEEGKILSAMPHRRARRWGVVILIAVIMLATCLAQTSSGHAMLQRAGLFEQPAGYTSLAFLSPQSVPKQLSAEKKTVRVSFTIRNAGRTLHNYRWSVLLVQGIRTYHINAGSVRVASGREVVIKRSARISCMHGQVRIVVSLAYPAEFIDAWAACSPGRR